MKTMDTYRIFVYLPKDTISDYLEKISPSIPYLFGEYDQVCWWSEQGTEQYREISTHKTERVASVRLEISIPHDEEILNSFVHEVLTPNHPWDEPVITYTQQKFVKTAL